MHHFETDSEAEREDRRLMQQHGNALPTPTSQLESLQQLVATQAQALKEAEKAWDSWKEVAEQVQAECDSLRSQLEAAQLEIESKGIIVDSVTEQYDAALDTVIALQGQLEVERAAFRQLTNSSLLLTEELRKQITGREEKLEAAVEALKPFADWGTRIPATGYPDNYHLIDSGLPGVLVGDLRRAGVALAKIGGKP